MTFLGSICELKSKLSSLLGECSWTTLNDNHHQLKSSSGGIMNFFPSTGKLDFQGPATQRQLLLSKVSNLLEENNKTPSLSAQQKIEPPSNDTPLKLLHELAQHLAYDSHVNGSALLGIPSGKLTLSTKNPTDLWVRILACLNSTTKE